MILNLVGNGKMRLTSSSVHIEASLPGDTIGNSIVGDESCPDTQEGSITELKDAYSRYW